METLESILSFLRTKRFRLTKARMALITVLFRSRAPLSVSELLERMKGCGTGVNKTTAYRELEILLSLGVVEKVPLSDRKQYYEFVSRGHHHHLVCLGCERVEDINVDESGITKEERAVARKNRFTVLRHSLEFFGWCEQCQAEG